MTRASPGEKDFLVRRPVIRDKKVLAMAPLSAMTVF
jgi:hypothetical protein